MTRQQLADLLDLDKVEAWAAAKPPQAKAGVRGKPCDCPIACYLRDQGAKRPQVYLETAFAIGEDDVISGTPIGASISRQLQYLVVLVDGSGKPRRRIQIRTLRKLIRQLRAELAVGQARWHLALAVPEELDEEEEA